MEQFDALLCKAIDSTLGKYCLPFGNSYNEKLGGSSSHYQCDNAADNTTNDLTSENKDSKQSEENNENDIKSTETEVCTNQIEAQ